MGSSNIKASHMQYSKILFMTDHTTKYNWSPHIAWYSICDRILENLPFGHKEKLWKNSIENLSNFFAHLDKATIQLSCKVSCPQLLFTRRYG